MGRSRNKASNVWWVFPLALAIAAALILGTIALITGLSGNDLGLQIPS